MTTRTMRTNRTGAIEFKDIPASEMRASNDRLGIIEGLVSKTGNIDLQDDRVMPGAWRDTIKSAYQRKAAGDPYLVPFLWSHSFDALPPGGVFYLDETRDGLFAKVQMNLDIQAGAELYASYRAGTVSKQSIGYKTLQSNYEKIEGKTVRNLTACELMECSAVVFPANPLATVSSVKRYWPGFSGKGGSTMNKLAVRGKDFNDEYAIQQTSDWLWDDWGDLTTALKRAVMACFSGGSDPEAALESDVIPQFAVALRQYVSDGVSLGYDPSQQNNYDMMSAGGGYGEKSGYIAAKPHSDAIAAVNAIEKHVKVVKRALSSVGSSSPAARAGQLAGWPVYGSMSEPSIFEEKEAEEDINLQLKLIATRLEVDNALRESHQDLAEMREMSSPTAGVERALQNLINSSTRR